MDDLNYRRLVNRPKKRCEACGATCYQVPDGSYRCVVCDHDRFETCLDCGHLRGWCECAPEPVAVRSKPVRAGAIKRK